MSLLSAEFLVFISLLAFFYYGPLRRLQWQLLLIASYAFYFISGPISIIYLLITTLTTYFAANKIDKLNREFKAFKKENKEILPRTQIKKKKEQVDNIKKKHLLFAILINFGMLAIFKYSAYIYSIINSILLKFNIDGNLTNIIIPNSLSNIILPLGISFYIFQSIGYVIDIYRGKYNSQRNIFKYALFVSYFPQMIQGPIGRYYKLSEQLYKKHSINYDEIKYGLQLVIWGYFKKILISDKIGVIVNTVFKDYTSYPGAIVFLSILCYGIQIYTDFSGGIDIVRGISQIFGIKMSINFKQPFFATSISDFWRRWHITLGTWLKDYLFYPLNLSKPLVKLNKKGRKIFVPEKGKFLSLCISTYLIYFIVGIWHGAGFKYIAFGLWNGTIISLSLLLESNYTKIKSILRIDDEKLYYRLFMIIRTNILVCIGRFFTRASGFKVAISMIKHTFLNFNLKSVNIDLFRTFEISQLNWIIMLVSIFILFYVDFQTERGINLMKRFEKRNGFIQFIYILLAVLFIVYFVIYSKGYVSTEFIYKQYWGEKWILKNL